MMAIDKILDFVTEVDKLKQVQRKTYTYHEKRYENSGEHSWHLALAVLAFAKEANNEIDILKCLKMALIHDLVEIDAGDQIVYAKDPGKYDRELLAAKRIFGLLPADIEKDFLSIWTEFEKKETEEAIFVGSLDRFLPLYSNLLNKGHSWSSHNISYDQVLAKNGDAIDRGVSSLWKKTKSLLDRAVSSGILIKK